MEDVLPQESDQPQPKESALASSWSLGRIVLISLGVLGLGMAIAFVGFYLGQR